MNGLAPIFERAASYVDQQTFLTYLFAYLACGYVVSTPTLFMMFRPIRRDASDEEIRNARHRFADPDCWLVWEAGGYLPSLLALFPFKLPYLAFYRRADPVLHVYPIDRFRALVSAGARTHHAPTT